MKTGAALVRLALFLKKVCADSCTGFEIGLADDNSLAVAFVYFRLLSLFLRSRYQYSGNQHGNAY